MTLKNLINFDQLTFDAICDKIRNGEHFSLARYGDGEFKAILGEPGANCDGHEYFPEMGRDLADTLRSDPDYYVGLHCTGRDNMDVRTLKWMQENNLTGREYVPNEVFHIPLRDGLFGRFWEALRGKQVFILAPGYVSNVAYHPDLDYIAHEAVFCGIRGNNTYAKKAEIVKMLDSVVFKGKIVLISASMIAPLIVDHLHRQYGDTATIIDFGSCFDPYVGRKSRSFHKNVM